MDTNWHIGMTLDQIEKNIILTALRFFNNSREQTAASLGISVRTIGNKLKLYEEQDAAKVSKQAGLATMSPTLEEAQRAASLDMARETILNETYEKPKYAKNNKRA